jgi:hypothetical protein
VDPSSENKPPPVRPSGPDSKKRVSGTGELPPL